MRQELKILYEDLHIIVCHKPGGIATQSRRAAQPDMERLILNHLAASERRRSPGKSIRPYLAVIHRLDQPVSGILVFAKTPEAAKNLNRQLTSRVFDKRYLALVDGRPASEQGTLTDYMVKDGHTNASRICEKSAPGAKQARLSYRVLPGKSSLYPLIFSEASAAKENAGCPHTLLEVTLDTGRHHQIRVQLAHMGCPIIGDAKYNPDAVRPAGQHALRLCAYKLSFQHPLNGRKMTFDLSEYAPNN